MIGWHYKSSKKIKCVCCQRRVLETEALEFQHGLYCSEVCAWSHFSANMTAKDKLGLVNQLQRLQNNSEQLSRTYDYYHNLLNEVYIDLLRKKQTAVPIEQHEALREEYVATANRLTETVKNAKVEHELFKCFIKFFDKANIEYTLIADKGFNICYGYGTDVYEVKLILKIKSTCESYGIKIYEGIDRAEVDEYFNVLDRIERIVEGDNNEYKCD